VSSIGELVRGSFDHGERRRLAGFFGGVALLHVAGWGLLFAVAGGQPTILALGGLAYTFGLRHAFDADHIAAIDNVTRKLIERGFSDEQIEKILFRNWMRIFEKLL